MIPPSDTIATELSDVTKPVDHKASRRGVLQAGLAAVGAVLAVPAHAQEKLAQSIVQYQKQPKNGQMCSLCVNFVAPNACKIVAGDIDPNGWCVAFAPKDS